MATERYQRIIDLVQSLGDHHAEFDEYELIQRVAYQMRFYDISEDEALSQIEAYYLESKYIQEH